MAPHSSDNDERANLVNRIIPSMLLSQGSDKARIDPRHVAPRDSAAGRFALVGNVIITGGTGAIGMATARAVLQHGITGLMIFDLGVAKATEKLDALRREFPEAKIEGRDVNVTDEEAVDTAVKETAQVFGSVDGLVCFAGIVHSQDAIETPASTFRKLMEVNTVGSFICARAAAQQMISQQTSPSSPGGRIIFTASISAHAVNYPQPQVAYNASKGALMMMKSSLAAEWSRYGITVNSISPGYMDTILNEGAGLEKHREEWNKRNPMGRMGDPEEVTGVVVMLLSRAGSYITGADYAIDGGGLVF
ncbi:enoyl-(Acyl carrier protein) reductase domain-containing protein [Sarocladium implicatum]|nr:enoyl-(Acyl carrier protein) reductase domain-containing protein [Sarocladium implicatum]